MSELSKAKEKTKKGDMITSKDYNLTILSFICKIFNNCNHGAYGYKFQEYITRNNRDILCAVNPWILMGDVSILRKHFYEIKISYSSIKHGRYNINNLNPNADIQDFILCFVDRNNNFKPQFYCVPKSSILKNPEIHIGNMHKDTTNLLKASIKQCDLDRILNKHNKLKGTKYEDLLLHLNDVFKKNEPKIPEDGNLTIKINGIPVNGLSNEEKISRLLYDCDPNTINKLMNKIKISPIKTPVFNSPIGGGLFVDTNMSKTELKKIGTKISLLTKKSITIKF